MSEPSFLLSKSYDSLAAECLYSPFNYPEKQVDFYERRIREQGGTALELACGAGRHLIPLVIRGLPVEGADTSKDALRFARLAAEQNSVTPQLHRQSMEGLDLPDRYKMIFIVGGSFQLIGDRALAIEALQRFQSHLVPGGQLLVDLFVPSDVIGRDYGKPLGMRWSWQPHSRPAGEGEIHVQNWVESLDCFEQVRVVKRQYELHVNGKIRRTELHTMHTRWYFKQEFVMMLESLGYTDIRFYGNHSDESASGSSASITYCAHRPKE